MAQPAADLKALVDDALSGLREGFNADGADLVTEAASVTLVRVRLVVTPETCQECILSTDVIRRMVDNAVRDVLPGVVEVQLADDRRVTN